MFGSYVVSAFIRYASNGAQVYARDAVAANRLAIRQAQLQGTLTGTEAAWLRNAAAIDAAAAARRRYIGMAMGAAAAVGAGAIIYGLKEAADWQTALTGVGIATNTANTHMAKFYELAVKISGITAQSVTTIAQEMAVAASSGLNNAWQLQIAFPLIAKAADVAYLSPKHLNPVEAVRELTQIVHLFGHYQGPAFTNLLNQVTKMLFLQPEGLQALLNQSRIFVPLAREAGVSQQDILDLAMAMGQTGFLRGRGGAGAARVMEYLMGASSMTSTLSRARFRAMSDLGLLGPTGRLSRLFMDSSGNLVWPKIVEHLEAIRNSRFVHEPMQFAADLANAFLAQGGRFMGALLLPSTYAKWQANQRAMERMPGIEGMWQRYSNTFTFGWLMFWTNLKNVFGAVFYPLLPRLTRDLKAAGNALGAFGQYLTKHPHVASGIAWTTIAATVALAAGAVANLTGWFVKFSPAVRGVALLIERIGPALAGFSFDAIPIVGWVTAAITAIIAIVPAFNWLVENLPTAIGRFAATLVRNESLITAFIGFFLGRTASIVVNGIETMAEAIASAATAFINNIWLLATPWGAQQLAAQVAAAYAAAMRGAGPQTNLFGPAFQAGYGSGMTFQQFMRFANAGHTTVHVHAGAITVDGAADPRKSAEAIFDMLTDPRSPLRTNGTTLRTHPAIPPALSASPL